MGSIVNDVRYFIKLIPQSRLHHVRREANVIPNRLARFGVGCDQDATWFDELFPFDRIEIPHKILLGPV